MSILVPRSLRQLLTDGSLIIFLDDAFGGQGSLGRSVYFIQAHAELSSQLVVGPGWRPMATSSSANSNSAAVNICRMKTFLGYQMGRKSSDPPQNVATAMFFTRSPNWLCTIAPEFQKAAWSRFLLKPCKGEAQGSVEQIFMKFPG